MNLRQRLREDRDAVDLLSAQHARRRGLYRALDDRNIEVMHPRFSPHLRAQISFGSCPRRASPSSFLD